jgi:hypothetical protein
MTAPGARSPVDLSQALLREWAQPRSDGRLADIVHRSTFLLAKPEANAGRRLIAIYEFLTAHAFDVLDVRAVHLGPAAVRALWHSHLDRAPAAVVRMVELNATAAPFTMFCVSGPGDEAPGETTAERLARCKGRSAPTAGDGSLRSLLGVTAPVMNFVHTPDTPARVLAELALLLGPGETEQVLARLAAGTPLDASYVDVVVEGLYRACGAIELDPAASLARLSAVAGANLPARVAVALDPGVELDPTVRTSLIMELADLTSVPIWDRLTLMAHAIGDSRKTFGMIRTKDLTSAE